MLVNYGYGHATYAVVPYHPDILEDKWVVMWGPQTAFHMGKVFSGHSEAASFSNTQQEVQNLVGGISGHWFMSMPPGTTVRLKHREVIWRQCGHLCDINWSDDQVGQVVTETDHDVTVQFAHSNKTATYSKTWTWVMKG